MRVKCVTTVPSREQLAAIGTHYREGRTVYPVEIGQEYTVLGVGFWMGLTWFEIAPSLSGIVSIPSSLFEVTSGKVSRHWDVRLHPDGALTFWPTSFYHKDYHYHVSEGHVEALEDFRYLFDLMQTEALGGH